MSKVLVIIFIIILLAIVYIFLSNGVEFEYGGFKLNASYQGDQYEYKYGNLTYDASNISQVLNQTNNTTIPCCEDPTFQNQSDGICKKCSI